MSFSIELISFNSTFVTRVPSRMMYLRDVDVCNNLIMAASCTRRHDSNDRTFIPLQRYTVSPLMFGQSMMARSSKLLNLLNESNTSSVMERQPEQINIELVITISGPQHTNCILVHYCHFG